MYHKRRPNFIVRGLYVFFNFLGDFTPMFDALFSFLGRTSLVVVNLVILFGTIIMSAAHSLELLRYAGLTGGLEWVGMTVWELVFIFSSILLANDYRRGNPKSGWATWTGFLMGFAFVEVSNVMGMAHNKIGVAIGIATPILLLVSKGLLAHQFKRKPEAAHTSHEVTQPVSHTQPHTESSHMNSHSIMTSHTGEDSHTVREDVNISHGHEVSHAEESHTKESLTHAAHTIGSHTEEVKQHKDSHETTHSEKESHTDTDPHNTEGVHTQTQPHTDVAHTDESHTENDSHTAKVSHTHQNSHSQSHTSQSHKDTESHTDTQTHTTQTDLTPIEWAVHLLEQDGSLPSIRRLAEVAGCSEWQARKALQELKKKIS